MGDLRPSERIRALYRGGNTEGEVDAIIRYLDERYDATAGLPQAEATSQRPVPNATCERGWCTADLVTMCEKHVEEYERSCDERNDEQGLGAGGFLKAYDRIAALEEQVAALTAERDELGRQLMAEIEAKLFNINEVVKWTGLATEHRKELHATRAELRKRDAVVEAAKALRLAQNNWALEEALYTALDALEALTQPAASDVLLVPAKDPARNPALIDSFWRDPGGTED